MAKDFFVKLIYLISRVFLAWTFLNFLAYCACLATHIDTYYLKQQIMIRKEHLISLINKLSVILSEAINHGSDKDSQKRAKPLYLINRAIIYDFARHYINLIFSKYFSNFLVFIYSLINTEKNENSLKKVHTENEMNKKFDP